VKLSCPYCSESIPYDAKKAGAKIHCSWCGKSLVLPHVHELPPELREEYWEEQRKAELKRTRRIKRDRKKARKRPDAKLVQEPTEQPERRASRAKGNSPPILLRIRSPLCALSVFIVGFIIAEIAIDIPGAPTHWPWVFGFPSLLFLGGALVGALDRNNWQNRDFFTYLLLALAAIPMGDLLFLLPALPFIIGAHLFGGSWLCCSLLILLTPFFLMVFYCGRCVATGVDFDSFRPKEEEYEVARCPVCKGKGRTGGAPGTVTPALTDLYEDGAVVRRRYEIGYHPGVVCRNCRGSGKVRIPKPKPAPPHTERRAYSRYPEDWGD